MIPFFGNVAYSFFASTFQVSRIVTGLETTPNSRRKNELSIVVSGSICWQCKMPWRMNRLAIALDGFKPMSQRYLKNRGMAAPADQRNDVYDEGFYVVIATAQYRASATIATMKTLNTTRISIIATMHCMHLSH